MLSRLFAFMVLVVLVGGGLYYWQLGGRGFPTAESFGEVGLQLRDTATQTAVRGAFRLNRNLEPYSIDVEAEDGVVVLRGELPRDELKALAEEVAGAVPDVRQVVNHLRISPEARPASRSRDRTIGESLDDEALEVQVRLAFSLNRDLKGSDIQISAYRKQLTLGGEVANDAQRRLGVRVARDTPGVTGVTDEIRVVGQTSPGDAARVERALAANANLAAYTFEVREADGRLILRGRVRSGAEKDLAGLLAQRSVDAPVENRLEIAEP